MKARQVRKSRQRLQCKSTADDAAFRAFVLAIGGPNAALVLEAVGVAALRRFIADAQRERQMRELRALMGSTIHGASPSFVVLDELEKQ